MPILIILLLSLWCGGCFSTREAGPDTGGIPDDGTVIWEGEKDLGNDDQSDQTDQPDLSDGPDLSDETTDDDAVPLPTTEVLFDDQIRAKVLAELDRAASSVRFVTYTFRDTGVLTKLNALQAAGIDVRGVAGAAIEEAGTPSFPLKVYEDDADGIVHEKFFVIDGATVLLTSANIAYQNILNFLVILRDEPLLAAEMTAEYDELAAGRRGDHKTIRCAPYCTVRDGKIVITPATCGDLETILSTLPAGEEAWLAMYGITVNAPMFDELRDLPGRGVTLSAILDDWDTGGDPANQTAFDDLGAAGATVAYYDGPMTFHHKFFVTPTLLAFGSMNWTYSGCAKNDEYYFITQDPALVTPFLDYARGL